MKEIIYFLPDVDAGVTSIVRNLLKYRPPSDYHYKVIFTRLQQRESVYVKDQFNVDEQVVFKYSKYENLYSVCKRLRTNIKSDHSIIVSNDGLELRMTQLLKLPNPLVYIIHGDFKYYYGLIHQNQGVIDRFIAYSTFTKQQLFVKLKKHFHNDVFLQYYPVPENYIQEANNKSIDLLFVGSLDKRKGAHFLKPIYNEIQKTRSNVKFNIVGSGEMHKELINQFGSDDNVNFKGQINNKDVFNEMLSAKVLLFPSSSEGLPNVVVEAMKAKCVPVCSDIPSGIPDLIEHGVTGYKIPYANIKEFSKAIIQLLNDEALRQLLAEKTQKKARRMFNPEKNAKHYENIIISTVPKNKDFQLTTSGGILNQPYLPNWLVILIRKCNISPKL